MDWVTRTEFGKIQRKLDDVIGLSKQTIQVLSSLTDMVVSHEDKIRAMQERIELLEGI